jgi:hypothetical protein
MSRPVSVRRALYNGRHPIRSTPLAGQFRVDEHGVGVHSWWRSVSIPWDEVGLIDIRAPKTPQRRVSRPRMFLFGLWAGLMPRKITATVVDVATRDGNFFVMIDHASPDEVRAMLEPAIARRGRLAA